MRKHSDPDRNRPKAFGGARRPGERTAAAAAMAVEVMMVAMTGGLLVAAAGCIRLPPVTASSAPVAVPKEFIPVEAPFQLKPDFDGPCAHAEVIDVDLGNTPESLVRAAHCQITGQPASPQTVQTWARRMREDYYVRRIDVVRSLCAENKRDCKLSYSDPWLAEPDLPGAPERHTKRDIGAVMMFFFECPGGTNCDMNWANTHAPGMDGPVASLGMKPGQKAPYHPNQPGFWRRELLDAQYAGLSFLMLNTYGPDIEDGKLKPLLEALKSIDSPIQIALFDDTWTWGEPYFGDFWKHKPDLTDPDQAAKTIYNAKWKPFFSQIDKKNWYRFDGHPFIYFYNAGTLEPRTNAAATVAKLKALFKADFGEEPFVDVDIAYFDDPNMSNTADAKFKWMTFDIAQRRHRSTLHGHIIDHAMVRWDAVNRDRPGQIANEHDRCVKGGQILRRVLKDSLDADLLILATWNDLGEGTGVNRNYDYFADGHWLPPHYFMQLIRDSQSKGKQ
ncbi:MAG TPA: DUF5010 domain-containing protein [Polyangia bacterium]|jgi:hypothetical protein|nr:DUF5010 domain-containing protein [Polyangia bacterium]